jgi:hypothetical protein
MMHPTVQQGLAGADAHPFAGEPVGGDKWHPINDTGQHWCIRPQRVNCLSLVRSMDKRRTDL